MSKVIQVGRLNVRYFTGGQGEPLVVIHGGGDSARSWLRNASVLSRHYRVYVPDLPGFGSSEAFADDFDLSDFATFIENFANSLGLKTFNLLGHSMGGHIAMDYTLKHPLQIRKLILVSSISLGKEIALWTRLLWCSLGSVAVAFLRAIRWLVREHPTRPIPDIRWPSVNIGRSFLSLKGQTSVMLDKLSGLLVPTLLVWGTNDAIVPVAHGYAASRVIPECQLHVFEGCGHSVYRQKLKEFCRLVFSFLG